MMKGVSGARQPVRLSLWGLGGGPSHGYLVLELMCPVL